MSGLKAFRGLFLALIVTVMFAAVATFFAHPLVIYNSTDSLPRGLYRVVRKPAYELGDLVVFPIPETVRGLVKSRHWLPDNAFLIKPIAARSGDVLSTKNGRCFSNGIDFGPVNRADRNGLPLPVFLVNRQLHDREIAVVSPGCCSFDSRYFGPIREWEIIGIAVPIWLQPGTARQVRKQVPGRSRQRAGEVREGVEIGSAR